MTISRRKIHFRVLLLFIMLSVFLAVSVVNLPLSTLILLFCATYLLVIAFFKSFLGSWKKVITSIEFIYLSVFYIYSIMGSIQFVLDDGAQRQWYFSISQSTMLATLKIYFQVYLLLVIILLGLGHPKSVFDASVDKLIVSDNISRRFYIADIFAIVCEGIFGFYLLRNIKLFFLSTYVQFRGAMNFSGRQYVWLYMMAYSITFLSGIPLEKKYLLKGDNLFRFIIVCSFWGMSLLIDRRHILPVIICFFLLVIAKKKKITLRALIPILGVFVLLLIYAVIRLGYVVTELPFSTLIYTAFGEFILTQYVTCYYIVNPVAGLLYGKTYTWYTLTKLVPRLLYSGKPEDLSVVFYNNVIKNGSAFAFNPIAEGLINFGGFSIFTTPIVIYFFMKLGIRIGKNEPLFYLMICAYSLDFFRGEFANCIFDILFLYICIRLMNRIKKNKRA